MIEIGYIVKTHGYKGDVKVRFHEGYEEGAQGLKAIFVERNGERIPYFLTAFHPTSGTEAILHFEDLENKEAAAALKGAILLARDEDITRRDAETAEPSEFIGLMVQDRTLGDIGVVEDYYVLPHQNLLVVRHRAKEVLIPMHENLVHEYHPGSGRIIFDLPEGFLDL